jgi:hypothetical protein
LTKTATATINVQEPRNEPQATPTTSTQKTEKQTEELKTPKTVEPQSTADVDYIVMLAMKARAMEGIADKYALAGILAMLAIFEAALQAARSKKLEEMLYARLKADSARDLGWLKEVLKELQIIILVIIIVFLLLILALSM